MVVRAGLLILTMLSLSQCREPQAEVETGDPSRRVIVVPFKGETPERNRDGAILAESLAARLGKLPSLRAEVGSGGGDYMVKGDVSAKDGRLVIAARLYQDKMEAPLWTATFWRKDSVNSELVGDLAAGLAEALFGSMARQPSKSDAKQ